MYILISQNLKIPYGFWDERLSSVAVERYFEKPKKSRKKNMINKKEIDNLAAAFILDGALQYINNWDMLTINNLPKLSVQNLSSVKDLTKADVMSIIEVANLFKKNNKEKNKNIPILNGRTIINLFFEPSTRTLISFEVAAKRLGADMINMNIEGSSLRKVKH